MTCGDGFCDPTEDNTTCAADCFCQNYACEPTESNATCPQDCP